MVQVRRTVPSALNHQALILWDDSPNRMGRFWRDRTTRSLFSRASPSTLMVLSGRDLPWRPGSKVRHGLYRQNANVRTKKEISVSIQKSVTAWINRLRTSESIKTLASHCFLVWFMAPKSAMAFAHTVADFGATTLARHCFPVWFKAPKSATAFVHAMADCGRLVIQNVIHRAEDAAVTGR